MTDSLSFKAYLKREGQDVEVRRFGIDQGAAGNYLYLRSKIQAMFPSIQNDEFQVYWQDSDQDYIRVDSDEELLVALTSANQQPLKIYVQVQNRSQGGSGASAAAGQLHPNVVCDSCEGQVVGYRYKCVTCADYDLCSRCEHNGVHNEHFMLRLPAPMDNFLGHPKFIRKLFTHPHKFHKRHGFRSFAHRGCGDSQAGPGRCPFTRRQDQGPAAGLAGVTDMFDFTALMDFIESLGVGVQGGEGRANQSTATEAPPAAGEAPPSSAGPSNPPLEPRRGSSATEYLNNIGQIVAAVLDPLGVDVSFDVRSKTTQQQSASSTPAEPSPAPTPASVPTPTPVAVPTSAAAPAPAPTAVGVSSSTTSLFINPPAAPTTAAASVAQTTNEPPPDDWTLLNRESPTRSEAMDVDESRGAKPKTPPPARDTPAPSAPPQSDDIAEAERKRIEDAIDTLRSMGFTFHPDTLRRQLRLQNCDIVSVLESMLSKK